MKNIIDTFISLLALTAIGISVYHYLVCHPSVEEMMELMNNDITGNYFNLDSLKTMTIEKGDLEAYYDLEKGLIHQSPTFEFDYLPYSLYMANKYHYADAYYSVYWSLTFFHPSGDLDSLDAETRELAISYLKKAARKGLAVATDELQEYDSQKHSR